MFYPVGNRDILAPPKLMGGLFLLFFPTFAFFYVGFPELGKWYLQYFPSSGFAQNVAITTCATVMALPLFLFGYLLGEKTVLRKPVSPDDKPYIPTKLGVFLVCAMIIVGFVGMLSYASSIGGIGAVLAQMESISSRVSWREVSSQYYYLGMFLMTAPAILALSSIYCNKGATYIAFMSMLMVLSSGFLMITQASREKAIFPLLLFIFSLFILSRGANFKRRRFLPHSLTLIAALLLVATFSTQTIFRASGSAPISVLTGLRDFNRIDVSIVMFVDYFNYASGNNFLFGLPILSYPNQFLVRLFNFEPIMNSSEILHQFVFSSDPDAGNPGSPLVGELYIYFGFLGYLLFVPAGYFFGRAHARLLHSGFQFWPSIFYSAALYFFMFKFCIYTGLSESVLMIMLVFFPLFMWKWMLKVRL